MEDLLVASEAAGAAVSVSALNRAVAGLLARGFPVVRVHGEIANFTRAASGHWYFTLKDDGAQVRCVMFRSRNALLGFVPREGDALELSAQVSLYEARGEYQLNVESAQRFGQGRLFEEFLRLKAQLAARGLFDEAHKRSLPRLPLKIGVVTSLQAAALRDVLTALQRRAPYAGVVVYPVPVQGMGAGQQIAEMLARVSQRGEVDVVLLVRGGGSIEDLWAFNEAVVAEAIRAGHIPVVVGVGHESDFTIADFAADLRAPTPTAAAELVAPDVLALRGAVDAAQNRLRRQMRRVIERCLQRSDYAARTLRSPRTALSGLQTRLAQLRAHASHATLSIRSSRQERLQQLLQRLQRQRPRVVEARMRAQSARNAFQTLAARGRQIRETRLHQLQGRLAALNPTAVLERGYAIVYTGEGHVVTNSDQLRGGDQVRMQFALGVAAAQILSSREEVAASSEEIGRPD